MITLYGIAISNYYNKVKFALLEKNIAFTEEALPPGQTDAVLKRSPLGKIPFIKTPDGYLSESQAILEYLEETFPEKLLYPGDAFERAKCRELIQHIELNVELIARHLCGSRFRRKSLPGNQRRGIDQIRGRPERADKIDDFIALCDGSLFYRGRHRGLAAFATGILCHSADL